MSNTRLIPLIIERDVRILFSDAFLVAIMFANFAIDLFVTAATFGRLVTGQGANYFLFIAPGSNLITAMVAAFQSGRDVWREKYIKDLTSYLLTLPVQRPVLAFSRVLGGVVRSVIATFPGTLVMGHRQKRNPALPILSQRIVLSSERVSSCPSPNSSVEPYDLGYSGVPAAVAHFLCTNPCWRFPRINIDPSRTLTRLCLARDPLLHLVLEALARLTLTNSLAITSRLPPG